MAERFKREEAENNSRQFEQEALAKNMEELRAKLSEALLQVRILMHLMNSINHLRKMMINSYDFCCFTYLFHKVGNVEQCHRDEMKAAHHLAHVKDLGRVAALRELNIEKDNFLSQLKFNKEVHNIMSFSLNTCEQTLNEIQPHVVTKLVEGRNKRLKLLEASHKQQKKDLDQRSMQSVTVSATHLEGFLVKAEKKHKESSEEAAKALQKLKEIFKPSEAREYNVDVDGDRNLHAELEG